MIKAKHVLFCNINNFRIFDNSKQVKLYFQLVTLNILYEYYLSGRIGAHDNTWIQVI